MSRQQKLHISYSCLKLFLDRENRQGLSLWGLGEGLGKGGYSAQGCVSGWYLESQLWGIFIHAPLQCSLEV